MMTMSQRDKPMQLGINTDFRNLPVPEASAWSGLKLVRGVLEAGSLMLTVEQALGFYAPIVDRYAQAGVTVVLVINQQTIGDGGIAGVQPPWIAGGMSWQSYAEVFGDACGKIARRLGTNVILQIWNEGDIKGESSLAITPQNYALILKSAIESIRKVSPSAEIYSQGHASSAFDVVRYWKAVVASYGSEPSVTVCLHPYGQMVNPDVDKVYSINHIPTGWHGMLNDYLSVIKAGLPRLKFAITEIGVSQPEGFAIQYDAAIANYMLDFISKAEHSKNFSSVIWFALYNTMRGAGFIDSAGREVLPQTAKLFRNLLNVVDEINEKPALAGYVMTNSAVNLRAEPVISSTRLAIIPRATPLDFNGCKCQIGNPNEWIAVVYQDKRGFVRGDLVVLSG
jgi:hypothetical protein